LIGKVKEWSKKYSAWSKQYDVMALELKDRGWRHVKTFLFLSYFTLGFAFFSGLIIDEYDSDKIIRVLFDENLFIFSCLTFLFFLVLFKLFTWWSESWKLLKPIKGFAHWGADCSFEFIYGLLIVYLVGFTIRAEVSMGKIPWFDLTNLWTYILFVLTVIFGVISLGLHIFVEKGKPKKSQAIKIIFSVGVFFGFCACVSNIIS
jgi:hypothetical protein